MKNVELSEKFAPMFEVVEDDDDSIRYILLEGGRGSGKSFGVGTWTNVNSFNKGWKFLYTRYNMTSANISVIPEFIEKSEEEFLDNEQDFDVFRGLVKNNKSDVEILFKGIQGGRKSSVSLKSLNGVNVWIVDEAEELDDFELFQKINLSIRTKKQKNLIVLILNPTVKTHWIYNFFYKETLNGKVTRRRNDTVYIKTSYLDNLENLHSSFISEAEKEKKENFERYRHIFMGDWASKIEGALWDIDLINKYRRDKDTLDQYVQIIVAIDPAVTNTEKSDETAICVAGEKKDGTYDILESESHKWKPREWALKAIAQYKKYSANSIVGEVNNGGDLVHENLKSVAKGAFHYKSVHASRGKLTRAEPVQSLYAEGKVYHTDYFTSLETEMVTFTGVAGDKSPNELDAMVWAIVAMGKKKEFKMFG